MGDSSKVFAPLRAHGKYTRHKTREAITARRHFKVAIGHLDRHHRRKRPELLAMFDISIEAVSRPDTPRCGQNAAMTQGTWTKFERAVHPADNAAVGKILRDALNETRIVHILNRQAVFSRKLHQRIGFHAWPPKGMIGHVAIRISKVNAIGIERGTQSATRIAGSRRHEYSFKPRFTQNALICNAIQRHAAAKTKIRKLGLLVKRPGRVDQDILKNPLNTGGAIGKSPSFSRVQVDRFKGISWRAEQFDKFRRK
jgi:hypothetical protein